MVAVDGAHFGALDYSSFVVVMLVSSVVGLYYGVFQKQDSVAEYFLGGRSMAMLPIAMSLIASNISGITMLAVPADIYAFGSQIAILAFVAVPVALVVLHFFLPTFYKLQYESSYEYLEHRFNRKLRTLSSICFTLGAYMFMPIVLYVPCLAFNQVSGVNVHIISPVTCLVCVFYTCVGGFKAVVWTDALQLVSLLLASVVVLSLSVAKMGVAEIWQRSAAGGRLELFNMDLDPTLRASFWSVLIGESLYFLGNAGVSPSCVQRFVALPTIDAAKKATWTLALGLTFTRSLSCLTGVIMYAYYYDCDPIATKAAAGRDNLLPLFVMDVAGDWPGLPGIFVAGIFSAALSTVSSLLNTLSGTLYKDFLEGWLPSRPSERRASLILKAITLILGFGIVALIFVVEKLGAILEVALSLNGITTGATFGMFVLGLFVPWAETVGAMCGTLLSIAVMSVICLGAMHAKSSGALYYPPLPTRTDGCTANSSFPLASTSLPPPTTRSLVVADDVPLAFRLSPFYYNVLGALLTVLVGAAVSAVVRAVRRDWDTLPDEDLLSPPVARLTRSARARATARAASSRSAEMTTLDKHYKPVATKESDDVDAPASRDKQG